MKIFSNLLLIGLISAPIGASAVNPQTNNSLLIETGAADSSRTLGGVNFTVNPSTVPVNNSNLTQLKPVVRGFSSNSAYVTGASRASLPKVSLNTAYGYTGDVGVTSIGTQPPSTFSKQTTGTSNKCGSPMSLTANITAVAGSSSYLPRLSAGISLSFSILSGSPNPGVYLGAVGSAPNSSFLVSCTFSGTPSPSLVGTTGVSYCGTASTVATDPPMYTRVVHLAPGESALSTLRVCPGTAAGAFKINVIVTPSPSNYGAWFNDTNPANQAISSNTVTVN